MKPGVTAEPRNFYAEATHEAPSGKAVLSNYGRFESVYGQNVSKTVGLGDYKVPLKNNNTMYPYEYAHNPELFNYTKTGKTQMLRKTQETFAKAGASAVGLETAPAANENENTQ